tara:strand:- start:222 stop:1163 length:942 start_codon:yes stop_codon:yes gene_type:complete
MRVLSGPHERWEIRDRSTAVAVGVFDGVHRGHQDLLKRLQSIFDSGPLVVLTFSRHPDTLIVPDSSPRLLTTLSQRAALLEELGVDVIAHLDFDEAMRDMSAADFVRYVLVGSLNARHIAVGQDFRFGKGGAGDVPFLQEMGKDFGYEVLLVSLIGDEDPFSSTRIREYLKSGDIQRAGVLLGRPYALEGRVESGEGRGRSIGVPTVNLAVDSDQLLPALGVYAVVTWNEGLRREGVANVGIRPTFGGTCATVEIHLLDFDGELYGEVLSVEFLHRIRDERKFSGPVELVEQILLDIDIAKSFFSGSGDFNET